jgi:hypothetical protein
MSGPPECRSEIIDDFDGLVARSVRHRPTPQVTIESIMYSVLERGLGALTELANIKRLTRCDDAARAQINERIARLIAEQEIAA